MSFNMDEFMEELDQETSALEAMISQMDDFEDDDLALEGLFRKPKPVEKLIEQIKKTIDKKCKTVEDCDAMLESLSNDETAFNTALANMKEAAQQFQAGEITKKEMTARIKPETKKLKKTCTVLSLKDINDKTNNVTDEELQNLRDVLVGAKDAINAKKEELTPDTASEGLAGFNGDAGDIAQEASIGTIAIGTYVALVTTIIALGVGFDKQSRICKKAINDVKRDIKPKMKSLKAQLKTAKKQKQWNVCVTILKDMETLNKKLMSTISQLTSESETGVSKEDGKGKTIEVEKIKKYNSALITAKNKYEYEQDYIKQQIVLYSNKAKKEDPANEAAYNAGFQAAIEAMLSANEIFESDDDTDDLE